MVHPNCRNCLSLSQSHDINRVILFAALYLPPLLVTACCANLSPLPHKNVLSQKIVGVLVCAESVRTLYLASITRFQKPTVVPYIYSGIERFFSISLKWNSSNWWIENYAIIYNYYLGKSKKKHLHNNLVWGVMIEMWELHWWVWKAWQAIWNRQRGTWKVSSTHPSLRVCSHSSQMRSISDIFMTG